MDFIDVSQLTDRELLVLIHERVTSLKEDAVEVEARVSRVELWQARLKGACAVLTVLWAGIVAVVAASIHRR